jgi:superfamily II DNA/RNA helicase
MSLIVDIISSGGSGAAIAQSHQDGSALTMIFCNTAQSCRAVQFALGEAKVETLAYHGELNSAMRSDNLKRFRKANNPESGDGPRVLVCTDLAARGLDVPEVDHVVMFDFPLNALDYLHRSGRTARGIDDRHRKGNGRVTALVTKRDKVLANAIEAAVQRGDPLDGLSSRRSDYETGGRLNTRKESSSSTTLSKDSRGRRRPPGAGDTKTRPSSSPKKYSRGSSKR